MTVNADLTPDRRLQSSGGQARNLYTELMKNMATRSKPEGNALSSIVERFVTTAINESKQCEKTVDMTILEKLKSLNEMVGGYDFSEVIGHYWKGYDTGNEKLMSDAIRWLRGEFSTRTDARAALGVRSIIDDSSFYDQLKLLSKFVRLAGYSGLLVNLDEMVNLYKIANAKSRDANYEQILRMLNDCMQGSVEGLGFLLGGTPEFVTDTRRGLYSYQALQSRLAENTFAVNGFTDMSSPVLRLSNLSPEDIYVLLDKLRNVYSSNDQCKFEFPDEGISAFMKHCSSFIGDAYFRTPRNTIRSFLDLLSILDQHPEYNWQSQLDSCSIEQETTPDYSEEIIESESEKQETDELASFKL